MVITWIVLLLLVGRTPSLPVGSKTQDSEFVIDYSILTDCEKHIQQKCIEVHGTRRIVFGKTNETCNIKDLIACFNAEKVKRECMVEDSGTVSYIDAHLKDVDPHHCMDEFGYTQLRELFRPAYPDDITHRTYSVTHRTYSSGDHAAFHDDSETDEVAGESGSGVSPEDSMKL